MVTRHLKLTSVNNMYLLSDFVNNITEGVLPGIHLDHSDTSDHLVHHLDATISDMSCLESERKEMEVIVSER